MTPGQGNGHQQRPTRISLFGMQQIKLICFSENQSLPLQYLAYTYFIIRYLHFQSKYVVKKVILLKQRMHRGTETIECERFSGPD